jgi:nucleoside-diphosphate-sugar epimerase
VTFDPDPNIVVTGVVSSIYSILHSAAKSPTVKSFVYTSSTAALAPPTPNIVRRLTAESFNEVAVEKAWAPPPYTPERALSVYSASKVQGEQALFAYAKQDKPHFVINSLVLGVNFGKVLDWSIPASSGDFVKEIMNGQTQRASLLTYRK